MGGLVACITSQPTTGFYNRCTKPAMIISFIFLWKIQDISFKYTTRLNLSIWPIHCVFEPQINSNGLKNRINNFWQEFANMRTNVWPFSSVTLYLFSEPFLMFETLKSNNPDFFPDITTYLCLSGPLSISCLDCIIQQ